MFISLRSIGILELDFILFFLNISDIHHNNIVSIYV